MFICDGVDWEYHYWQLINLTWEIIHFMIVMKIFPRSESWYSQSLGLWVAEVDGTDKESLLIIIIVIGLYDSTIHCLLTMINVWNPEIHIHRLEICQKIYTTQFLGKIILHTENAYIETIFASNKQRKCMIISNLALFWSKLNKI